MQTLLNTDQHRFEFSADELQFLLDESPDIFCITDMTTRQLMKANRAHDQLFGTESRSGDFIGWIHPDDQAFILEKIEQNYLSGNHTSIVECRCRTKTGEYVWMQWRSTVSLEKGLSYSIGRIIQEQKEAQLRSAQLASLVEFSADGIIGVGLDKVIRTWNKGASAIFGLSHEEAEGMLVEELFTAESNNRLAKEGLGSRDTELTCIRKNGQTFFASVVISDVLDHNHKCTGYVITIRDITERKQVEKRVKEFYSTVSHELRTPLTSILGTLTLISAENLSLPPDVVSELVDIAKDSCHRLIRLINEILDLQKIESGKFDLRLSESCPVDLMNKAMKETSSMAEDRGACLHTQFAPYLPKLNVDADKIVQVLTNLISNATKFSESKPIKLSIQCLDRSVRFAVSDQGPGIPTDQSHKLFGKFQQIDSSDSRKYGGTGLGLAISKNIVELHGGKIGYENNEESGCTFWFEIPINEIQQKLEAVEPLESGISSVADAMFSH